MSVRRRRNHDAIDRLNVHPTRVRIADVAGEVRSASRIPSERRPPSPNVQPKRRKTRELVPPIRAAIHVLKIPRLQIEPRPLIRADVLPSADGRTETIDRDVLKVVLR